MELGSHGDPLGSAPALAPCTHQVPLRRRQLLNHITRHYSPQRIQLTEYNLQPYIGPLIALRVIVPKHTNLS